MKKNFKWLINLATLVLCVCALAIGVYAAKQASLTATGTIGFTAHGCKVKVSGTIDAYIEGGSEKLTGTDATIAETLVDEEGEELSLPAMYFSDLEEKGNIITINLKITSDSDFPVLCNIPNPVAYDSNSTTTQITAVQGVTSHQSFVLSTKGEYKDITIKFTLTDIETASEISAIFDANLEFKKYTLTRDMLNIATADNASDYITTGTMYVEMGTYPNNSTTYGDFANKPIRWYAFAYNANGSEEGMQAVTTFANKEAIGAGTYYFISEYSIGESKISNNAYGSQVLTDLNYGDSLLNTAIENLATTCTMKDSEIYNQIAKRTLPGESLNYYYDKDGNSVTPTPITKSTLNSTLWAISDDEFNMLSVKYSYNVDTTSSNQYESTGYGTMGASCLWWLRSPYDYSAKVSGAYARYVDPIGYLSNNGVIHEYGVRAAFKLVIV
ncbi:MAG: hypothetical protein E7376_02380 [Clostridiales bacterium]|nr:hypothetical protein [Clostridiales bacterium]